MRLVWATDLHLDSVERGVVERFCADVNATGCDGVLITGDIAESKSLINWLEYLEDRLRAPIYFVLGNHDFYASSVEAVRTKVGELTNGRLFYLPRTGRVQLTPDVALVGHDGWGDCRLGDVDDFGILSDYFAIADLAATIDREKLFDGDFERGALRDKLRELGDQVADEMRVPLQQAAEETSSVLVLTHVPPFRESCWYEGRISDPKWLPGFTCWAVGNLLLSVAETCTDALFNVLCGHTHCPGQATIRPNLHVHTGFGTYGRLTFGFVNVDGGEISVELPSES